MEQRDRNYSLEETLSDTRHNSKAVEVFFKLIAKQKKGKNPLDELRSYTPPLTINSKI